jgi:hypothetical protein
LVVKKKQGEKKIIFLLFSQFSRKPNKTEMKRENHLFPERAKEAKEGLVAFVVSKKPRARGLFLVSREKGVAGTSGRKIRQ